MACRAATATSPTVRLEDTMSLGRHRLCRGRTSVKLESAEFRIEIKSGTNSSSRSKRVPIFDRYGRARRGVDLVKMELLVRSAGAKDGEHAHAGRPRQRSHPGENVVGRAVRREASCSTEGERRTIRRCVGAAPRRTQLREKSAATASRRSWNTPKDERDRAPPRLTPTDPSSSDLRRADHDAVCGGRG